jgi:hypothetical protein
MFRCWMKSWWHPLVNLNTSKKLKNLHNILELNVHFKSNLILIQQLDEDDWIKSMYTKYIFYSFSMAIGLHVCDSWHITKQKEIEKIVQCPSFISLWYGSGVFPKMKILLCIHCLKMQKNMFWMEFHPKTLNMKLFYI